jgi:hypothetical protein
VYVAGPLIGAAITVMIINTVRDLPTKEERQATSWPGWLGLTNSARPASSPEVT